MPCQTLLPGTRYISMYIYIHIYKDTCICICIVYSIDVDACSIVLRRHWPHDYICMYLFILHIHVGLGSRVCPNDLVHCQSYIYTHPSSHILLLICSPTDSGWFFGWTLQTDSICLASNSLQSFLARSSSTRHPRQVPQPSTMPPMASWRAPGVTQLGHVSSDMSYVSTVVTGAMYYYQKPAHTEPVLMHRSIERCLQIPHRGIAAPRRGAVVRPGSVAHHRAAAQGAFSHSAVPYPRLSQRAPAVPQSWRKHNCC